ncbi:hypothetical protein ACERK3_06790 [Phycisphaerales bacterium AB-hyl4]|uniref:Uncharacterized protein n=1 Tax=Natronomicrosphaera hydrolytica TaxID=3242702 RepID=A0ABV4U340_9BACT
MEVTVTGVRMAVRKICFCAPVLALVGLVGCTAPRSNEIVLIEPTYSYHRDQAAASHEVAWPVVATPFADRPASTRLHWAEASDRDADEMSWQRVR